MKESIEIWDRGLWVVVDQTAEALGQLVDLDQVWNEPSLSLSLKEKKQFEWII